MQMAKKTDLKLDDKMVEDIENKRVKGEGKHTICMPCIISDVTFVRKKKR